MVERKIAKYNTLERRIVSRIWYFKRLMKHHRNRYLELDLKKNLLEHRLKDGLVY